MNAEQSIRQGYVAALIDLYLRLPETPLHPAAADYLTARDFQHRNVSLDLLEAALLLGSLRRLLRPADLLPLPPIRSLAYFRPVIEELLVQPLPPHYLDYLRLKLLQISTPRPNAQKNTFPDAR